MANRPSPPGVSNRLDVLAEEIYTALAAQFPVCLASDEFHFFPQFKATAPSESKWDDFSEGAIHDFCTNIKQWQTRLDALRPRVPASDTNVEIDLLARVLTTLHEQFKQVHVQHLQPTFYLTIVSIGLAEALAESRDALEQRLAGLPFFLETARTNLVHVQQVAAQAAAEMIPRLRNWISMLALTHDQRRSAESALVALAQHMERIDTTLDFRLPGSLYARVADHHMGCQMGLEEISWHLDQEIEAAESHLMELAGQIRAGCSWQAVFHDLPCPSPARNDVAALYQGGIASLKKHCMDQGFFTEDHISGCDVEIQTIPAHMTPVRANAAYSMPPGHPPRGGVFFVMPLNRQPVPRDMMLLAAHETYPGHHLLDTMRWNHRRPLRRCLEFPLFYEGWASFNEEILFDTEFFSGPADRLMMAKRRFWRALRGRTDLRLHTGRCTLDEAALELAGIGLVSREQALQMVRRYALKPGYQLAYAIGRRKFRQLYATMLGQGRPPAHFVRSVLAHAEIGFDHLAEHLLYQT